MISSAKGCPSGAKAHIEIVMTRMRRKVPLLAMLFLLPASIMPAQSCTTQSQMTAAERNGLAEAGRSLALKVQAGDTAGLQAATAPEYAKDFSGVGNVVATVAP